MISRKKLNKTYLVTDLQQILDTNNNLRNLDLKVTLLTIKTSYYFAGRYCIGL